MNIATIVVIIIIKNNNKNKEIIVGPEMMPNAKLSLLALMNLNYKVNTNTKQRRIKLNK